jgi:hypothetical protein
LHGVAVLGAAAAGEMTVFDHRPPSSAVCGPAAHRRLLVDMSAEQDCRVKAAAHLHENNRGALVYSYVLDRELVDRVCTVPARDALGGLLKMAIGLPVLIATGWPGPEGRCRRR